jgi:hypothetical protein
VYIQLWGAPDRFLQQSSAQATAPELFADVKAKLDGTAISAAREKFLGAKPASNHAFHFRDQNWMLCR